MVAESLDLDRETYLAILMDREYNGPVIVASSEGGMEIEELAETSPDKILKVHWQYSGATNFKATLKSETSHLVFFSAIKFYFEL